MPIGTSEDRVKERILRQKLLVHIPLDEKISLFEGVADQYSQPHRKYHTLEHIDFCLEIFDEFRHLAKKPDSLEIAIIFHDLSYATNVPARTNEEMSALAMVEAMLKYNCNWTDTLLAMSAVLATTHDHTPATNDNKLIVDVDLAGLGASWEVFLQNNLNVREEYRQFSDEDFRKGNSAVLQRFLDRTPLYYHPEIEAKYGAQAKDNLNRWLTRA